MKSFPTTVVQSKRQHVLLLLMALAAFCLCLPFAQAQGKYEPQGDAVFHGAGLPEYWSENKLRQQLRTWQQVSGKDVAVITWFASTFENGSWSNWPQSYANNLRYVKKLGAVSLIKYQTWDYMWNSNGKWADTRAINQGVYDQHFQQFADTIKAFGDPVFISLNHEMNGDWYPYSQDNPKTNVTAADYVASYQRIVNIFRQRGVNNVAWVWAPNVPDVGSVPFTAYYPGDSFVDWIGPSFYSGNAMNAMDELYNTYAKRKPFFVTEWATATTKNKYNSAFPGDARWVADFFQTIQQRYPRVKGISWFQYDKEDGNHLLQRVPPQGQSYEQLVQNPRYITDADNLRSGPPGGVVVPPREVIPREIVLPDRTQVQRVPVQQARVQTPAVRPPVQRTPVQSTLSQRLQLSVTPRQNTSVQR